jgi:tetratricopeptide (TPR) repeat protein
MAEAAYTQLVVCAQCGQETPNYEDCVLCGHSLHDPDAPPRELAEDDLQAMMMDAKLEELKAKRQIAYADAWDHAPWLERLRKLAEIAPDHPMVHYYIGAAYTEQGQCRPAIVSLTRALSADPSLADAYRRRADCQYILVPVLAGDAHAAIIGSLGRWEEAIREYGQAVEREPQYAETYFNRGYAYKVVGEREVAIADFEHFLSLGDHWNEDLVAQAQAHIKELNEAD